MKKTILSIVCAGVMTLAASVQAQQTADTTIATFENLALEAESYYNGDDASGDKTFRSGNFLFVNTYNYFNNDDPAAGGYWSGFGYANLTASLYDGTTTIDSNAFRCVAGKGAEESSTYALAYADVFFPAMVKTADTTGQVIAGAYFTNNATAVNSALHGDNFGLKAFAQGDFMKVHCVGFLGDDTVGATDIYLIDYRSEDPDEHYILQEWKWFDLAVLGKVNRVEFAVISSQQNQFGELFPQYFCLDNFGMDGVREDPIPSSCRTPQEVLAAKLYPVPARDMLTLSVDQTDYTVEIFQPSGRPVKTLRHLNGETSISVSDLTAGVYLLRITAGNTTRTLRFVKA